MKKLVLATILCMQMLLCNTVYGSVPDMESTVDSITDESVWETEDSTPTESILTETEDVSAETDSSISNTDSYEAMESDNEMPDNSIAEESIADSVLSDASVADISNIEHSVIEDESVSNQETVGVASAIAIKTATLTIPSSVSYTGKALKPVPTVTMNRNGKTVTLQNKTDYKISYKNNINPGRATVTITGIGRYTGSISKIFAIKAPIAKTTITYKAVVAASTGEKNLPVITFKNKTLEENKQYKLTKTEKKEDDTYTKITYKITGIGYYTGTVTKTYTRIRNTDTIQNGNVYKLIPLLDTKTCIGVGSLTWENTGIYVKPNTSSAESRKFIFKSCGNGKWNIVNQYNDFVWTGKNANASLSQPIVSRLGEKQTDYQFTATANKDGSFSFLSVKSGCAVQIQNTKQAEGSGLYLNKRNTKAVSQKFYIVPVSATAHTYTGTYQISSTVKNSFVWTVQKGKKANTTNICIGENKNLPSQKFRLLYSGNGTYRIQCVFSYSMLDVNGAKYDDFTNVQQYEWNGTNAQKWKVIKNSDGTYTFLSAGNNTYALDLYAGQAVENGNLDIYRTNGTKAQKWKLTKTSDIFPARPTVNELQNKVTGEEIVAYAKTWVGKISYTLGANGPLYAGGKSDCSWFIFRVLEHFELMENWHKSLEYGRGTVPNTKLIAGGIANAKPGDILVWNEGPDTGHVTIYAGNNMAVGCNGITNVTGQVEYRWYTEPCGRNPDAICRLTNLA